MKEPNLLCKLAVVLILGWTLKLTTASAQNPSADVSPQTNSVASDKTASNDQDPPLRVARLSYVDGSVSVQAEGADDWLTGEVNRPLISGDNLWSDQNSRAEIQIGSAALRLGAMSGITLLEVTDHGLQVRLVQGTLIVSIRHAGREDAYEFDTPNVAFAPAQAGEYRVDVSPDGTTTDVTVWHGRGEVTGGGYSYPVVMNQRATFSGTDPLTYDVTPLPGSDGFAAWAQHRDEAQDQDDAETATYVSPEMTGYQDLEGYGDWIYVAGYGYAWRPRALAADWAPYRFGHWASIGPWGWTWVADEPWGFAPFHYGRWAFAGTNWVWVPGPAAVRPVYAPALVAWLGAAGAHPFGAAVGWLPLAPGEVFLPYYRVSRSYVNAVNLTNTHVEASRIAEFYGIGRSGDVTYANRSVTGGLTFVSRETFAMGQPVAKNIVRELGETHVARNVDVESARTSRTAPPSLAAKPPVSMTNRQVVAVRVPSVPVAGAPGPGRPILLVRQQPAAQHFTAPHQPGGPTQTHAGFGSFEENKESSSSRTVVRVWEEQGTPEPARSAVSEKTATQSGGSQSGAKSTSLRRVSSPQSSHPAAKPPVAAAKAPSLPKTRTESKPQENHSPWHQSTSWSASGTRVATSTSAGSKFSAPAPAHK